MASPGPLQPEGWPMDRNTSDDVATAAARNEPEVLDARPRHRRRARTPAISQWLSPWWLCDANHENSLAGNKASAGVFLAQGE